LRDSNVFVKPSKTTIAARKVSWCGFEITPEGYRRHPNNLDAVLSMPRPHTAAELQRILVCLNWIRDSFPTFAQRVAPLQQLLHDAIAKAKTAKKSILLDWIGPRH